MTMTNSTQKNDLHHGYMCIDENKMCMAFSFDPIFMDGYQTIEVTWNESIDFERIQGYALQPDTSLTWSQTRWEAYEREILIPNKIRERRETECYAYVNRGTAWYDVCVNTEERKAEFQTWYQAWLNAPQTLEIPEKPDWMV